MKEVIKIGCIGLGRRGRGVLFSTFAQMADVRITAICDVRSEMVEKVRNTMLGRGHAEPACYTDYREMLKEQDLDAVFIGTGWKHRVSIAIDAMRAGVYAAIEVGCAYDIMECHRLIEAYEQTQVPVMMLENCCYGRREMMALRMAQEGLFGEIVFCAGGYHHNLNPEDLYQEDENGNVIAVPNTYRLHEYMNRNCEQYPTHELGPISKVLNINRGNRMMSLRSFASMSKGLKTYIRDHVPEGFPYKNAEPKQADIVTTIITCANGEQIRLTLDTTLPRHMYSRGFTIRGTKGMCEEHDCKHASYFLEGMKEGNANNEDEMFKLYDHPLHKEYATQVKEGHGGMDWLVTRAFVESVKNGTQTPIDVYDTALWMSIGALSEESIARGGDAVMIPDFTKGRWFSREPVVQSKYSLDTVCEDPDTPIDPGLVPGTVAK